MKILFTKKSIEKEVRQKINSEIECEFVDVLKIKHRKESPFSLSNKSLIFTSVNGVQSFFENGFMPEEDFTNPYRYNKIYAVGNKTKKELRKNGFGTFKVAKHASELLDFIIEHASKEQFIHFCGNMALDLLNEKLPLQNIVYRKVILYDTELLHPKIDENHDAVCFFSPSGVRSFAKLNSLEGKTLFSIGEKTEKELKNWTKNKIYTSKESSLNDLLNLINTHYKTLIS
jgi:uroporphyrinogen-III synthase